MEAVLRTASTVIQRAERFCYVERSVVIGRGFNYATAFETALKLKELTYTVVEPYSSADFLHGPLAMMERGFPAMVVAPSGRHAGRDARPDRDLREREAEVVCISDQRDLLEAASVGLRRPDSRCPSGSRP